MSFMQLYCEHMQMWRVETTIGDELVHPDLLGDNPDIEDFAEYCEGEPVSAYLIAGWFAWYSAPGYMDRTDYCGPFETEDEAITECKSLYGDE